MGGWIPGEAAFLRGKNIFTQLKDKTWMEYLLFAVTGNEDPETARLIETIWVIGASYPEPRLWNNRIAALAGTSRSTGHLAIAGATAASEAMIYGARPNLRASDFLYRAQKKLDQGIALDEVITTELRQNSKIYGYGRPITKRDERIEPLMDYIERAGIVQGKYTKLAFAVDEYFCNSTLALQANITALMAGLMLDRGLKPREIYNMAILTYGGGMQPCYLDTQSKPEGALFPLRCSRIRYVGTKVRQWTCDRDQ
jgi:hypothetical protein